MELDLDSQLHSLLLTTHSVAAKPVSEKIALALGLFCLAIVVEEGTLLLCNTRPNMNYAISFLL